MKRSTVIMPAVRGDAAVTVPEKPATTTWRRLEPVAAERSRNEPPVDLHNPRLLTVRWVRAARQDCADWVVLTLAAGDEITAMAMAAKLIPRACFMANGWMIFRLCSFPAASASTRRH